MGEEELWQLSTRPLSGTWTARGCIHPCTSKLDGVATHPILHCPQEIISVSGHKAILALRVWNTTSPVVYSGFAKQSSPKMSESNDCPCCRLVAVHRWKTEMSFRRSNCGLRCTQASSKSLAQCHQSQWQTPSFVFDC
jgi:hypothetical protein